MAPFSVSLFHDKKVLAMKSSLMDYISGSLRFFLSPCLMSKFPTSPPFALQLRPFPTITCLQVFDV